MNARTKLSALQTQAWPRPHCRHRSSRSWERRFPIRRVSAGVSTPAGPEAGAPGAVPQNAPGASAAWHSHHRW